MSRKLTLFLFCILRGLTLLAVSLALALSITASVNCHFLKFENDAEEPWGGLEAPFDGVYSAYVGVFGYEILRAEDDSMLTDGCVSYDGQFGKLNYFAIMAAQFCAILGPALAVMGIIVNVMDTCLCRFLCSFLIGSALFLAACGVQAGTFSIYAEPDFCFQGDQYCNIGASVVMSGISTLLYFCGCILLCCFPTPDPYFDRPQRKPKAESGVVQPVFVEDDDEEDYDEDYEEEPKPRRKPKKKAARVSKNADITDDEFNFESHDDQDGHVEYKETTLPDGTVEVDEITYHPDGSQTIITRTYDH
eukprot:Nitzschia sp. Nitz4//scaffold7_size249615//219639//220629//NITZ4_001209-RA/size249615-augustus-gene-0.267-mRNA-1//-1//CDS//3329558538//1205//frame0